MGDRLGRSVIPCIIGRVGHVLSMIIKGLLTPVMCLCVTSCDLSPGQRYWYLSSLGCSVPEIKTTQIKKHLVSIFSTYEIQNKVDTVEWGEMEYFFVFFVFFNEYFENFLGLLLYITPLVLCNYSKRNQFGACATYFIEINCCFFAGVFFG